MSTLTASFVRPFWTQKCRLASPSVTNERREWPSSLSRINPAWTAAVRIMLCWGPSQPFGWVRTNSVRPSKVCHDSTLIKCVSSMKVRAHWWRYRRKSAKTSMADFPRGSGGILLVTYSLDWALGRRWSLNLIFQLATPMEREGGVTPCHSAFVHWPSSASSSMPSQTASAPTARTFPSWS